MLSYNLEKHIYAEEDYVRMFGKSSLGFTDGSSITFLASEKSNTSDVLFVTIHELLHVISDHCYRAGGRDRILWNLAVDQVVNTVLYDFSIHTKYIRFKDTCFFMKDYYDQETKRYDNAETIYEFLKKNEKRFKIEAIPISSFSSTANTTGDGDDGDDGDSNGNGGDNNKSTDSNGDKNNNGNSGNGKNNGNTGNGGPNPIQTTGSGSNLDADTRYVYKITDTKTGKTQYVCEDTKDSSDISDDEKKKLEKLKTEAKLAWTSNCIDKGSMPGHFIEYLDKFFEVELPWDDILENAILYNVQNSQEVAWSNPNEIFRHLGILLPGEYKTQEAEILVVGVDTSGSIGSEDLRKFVGVIYKSAAYYSKIYVIVHDVPIQAEIEIEDTSNPEIVIDAIKNKMIGRGGTSHQDVLERIGELVDDVPVSTVIFLTDFYSDVEHYKDENPWMKDTETIWVLNRYEKHFEVDLGQHYETKTILIPSIKDRK
jgi:predicted metal-dependent peptidase